MPALANCTCIEISPLSDGGGNFQNYIASKASGDLRPLAASRLAINRDAHVGDRIPPTFSKKVKGRVCLLRPKAFDPNLCPVEGEEVAVGSLD